MHTVRYLVHMASLLFNGCALPQQILLFIVISLFKKIIIHVHLKNVADTFNLELIINKNTVLCTPQLGTSIDNEICSNFKNSVSSLSISVSA